MSDNTGYQESGLAIVTEGLNGIKNLLENTKSQILADLDSNTAERNYGKLATAYGEVVKALTEAAEDLVDFARYLEDEKASKESSDES